MARAYLVSRLCKVTYEFMAMAGIRPTNKGDSWYSPVFGKEARIFTSKEKADAYMRKMNRELHRPNSIDISGFTDYKVIPVERGQ